MKKKVVRCKVIAGPLGFYGCAYERDMGDRKDTKDDAMADAEKMATAIDGVE